MAIRKFHILNDIRSQTICGLETENNKPMNTYNNESRVTCQHCIKTWTNWWKWNDPRIEEYIPVINDS